MKNKKNFNFNNSKSAFIVFGFLVVALLVLHLLTEISRSVVEINYSTFLNKVEASEVKKIYVKGQVVRGVFQDGTFFTVVVPEKDMNWNLLRSKNIEFALADQSEYSYYWYFVSIMLFLLVIAAVWYFMRNKGCSNGGGTIFTMGKSKAKMFMPSSIKENFDSVAGAQEAKEELADIVDFLKNPKKYSRLGAKIPKGVLLVGEPGNGKTLLARAVAGEANCPFFSVSGADFIEVFIGLGAARVRDLFAQARKQGTSIIFIDEIDAVGRHRGSGLGGGNDEREQTLNQLLTEMDGFQVAETPIIVIAATNRPDVLDKALLRPGRFDLQVEVPFPDLQSRKEILAVHAKNTPLDPSVDLEKLARGTPGFSGADLANLINQAALLASKNGQDLVTIHHFEEVRDKILLGKERKSISLTEEDKKVIAYHEGGHALMRLLMPEYTDPLHKVTIIPRGRALGVTHFMPEREKYITSKEEMEASVIAALGGRVAEEIVFNRLTTGAYSDFKVATDIVRKMVCAYGMVPDDLGTVLYVQQGDQIGYSEKTAEKIDNAIKSIMDSCHQKARALFEAHRDMLDKLANALLEKETMYASEIYDLLGIQPRAEHRFN